MFPWSQLCSQRPCWLSDSVGKLSGSRKIHRKADQTAFFCLHAVRMQCCWPVRPPGCENNKLPSTWSCFFTLYILSIFTHKMYMIGMHIIFLLTDSFNKALCQSAASVSTFCLLRDVYNRLNSQLRLKVQEWNKKPEIFFRVFPIKTHEIRWGSESILHDCWVWGSTFPHNVFYWPAGK